MFYQHARPKKYAVFLQLLEPLNLLVLVSGWLGMSTFFCHLGLVDGILGLPISAPPLAFSIPHSAPCFPFKECPMNGSGGTVCSSWLVGVWGLAHALGQKLYLIRDLLDDACVLTNLDVPQPAPILAPKPACKHVQKFSMHKWKRLHGEAVVVF